MEIQGEPADWSIGRLAEVNGLEVKTVRFYSDAGLLPSRRSAAGHRRYAPADLPRLQLIRSLRALDVDLDTIADLLTDAAGLQETLLAHAKILEVRLHALQRQLAVTRAATEAPAEQTLARLHALTRIDAAEREQLLDRFWDAVLRDTPDRDAGWFRNAGRPQLPAQPTAAHLDAWLELAELAPTLTSARSPPQGPRGSPPMPALTLTPPPGKRISTMPCGSPTMPRPRASSRAMIAPRPPSTPTSPPMRMPSAENPPPASAAGSPSNSPTSPTPEPSGGGSSCPSYNRPQTRPAQPASPAGCTRPSQITPA